MKKEILYIRKLNNKSDLKLVKTIAQNAEVRSITLKNYKKEFRNPFRRFYALEDKKGNPVSILSVIERNKKNKNQYAYSQFKTGKKIKLKVTVATEDGYSFQKRRGYKILKKTIIFLMLNSRLANVLALPILSNKQKLLSVVTGEQRPAKPLKSKRECTVREHSKHIDGIDKELGMVTIGYSHHHGGSVRVTTRKRLAAIFKSRLNDSISIERNKIKICVLVDKDNKIVDYGKL